LGGGDGRSSSSFKYLNPGSDAAVLSDAASRTLDDVKNSLAQDAWLELLWSGVNFCDLEDPSLTGLLVDSQTVWGM
jgi:hypothetical protein